MRNILLRFNRKTERERGFLVYFKCVVRPIPPPGRKKGGEKLKMSFFFLKDKKRHFDIWDYEICFVFKQQKEEEKGFSSKTLFPHFCFFYPKNRYYYIAFTRVYIIPFFSTLMDVRIFIILGVWWWVPLSKTSHLMLTPVQPFSFS
jgi:hypothetical protein